MERDAALSRDQVEIHHLPNDSTGDPDVGAGCGANI